MEETFDDAKALDSVLELMKKTDFPNDNFFKTLSDHMRFFFVCYKLKVIAEVDKEAQRNMLLSLDEMEFQTIVELIDKHFPKVKH